MQLPAAYAWPLALTVGVAAGLRWITGPERLRHLVGVALPVGFLVPWALAVAPGQFAYDSLGRIGHVALGAALLGVLLDIVQLRRSFAGAAVLLLVVGCAWAESQNGFIPPLHKIAFLLFVGVTALAAATGWWIDRLGRKDFPFANPNAVVLIVLAMLVFAITAIAVVANDPQLEASGFLLASAILGYLAWLWCADAPLPSAAVLPATAGMLALAWCEFDRDAHVLPGLAVASLILFADGTAARVPLPKAGVSRVIYPAVLAGIALLPMFLAIAVSVALRHL